MAKKKTEEIKEETKHTPKHSKGWHDEYFELLEEACLKDVLHMFVYVGSNKEAVEHHSIYRVSVYREEMSYYVEKYGYEVVNEFALSYAEKVNAYKEAEHE